MTRLRPIFLVLMFAVLCAMIWTQIQPRGQGGGARSDVILDMLDAVPAASFEDAFTLEYGDVQAAISFAQIDPDATLYGFANAGPREIVQFGLQQRDGMKAVVGFEHADIDHILQLSHDGRTALVVDLLDGAAGDVMSTIAASGYGVETRGDTDVFARGSDLGFDRNIADVADFFGGGLGIASRVAVLGDRVLQARDWDTIDAMVAPTRMSPTTDADLVAALRSLDAPHSDLNDATLIKVTALSGMADRGIGMDTVTVPHFVAPARNIAVLSLPAPNRDAAQSLADRMTQNWAGNVDIAQGIALHDVVSPALTPVFDVVDSTPPVVRMTLTSPLDGGLGIQGDPAQNTVFALVMSGHLPALTGQN